jgi:hypothetical protein
MAANTISAGMPRGAAGSGFVTGIQAGMTGSGRACVSVITYMMPVVALLLGAGLPGEKLTIGAIAGLILIALGARLATGRRRRASMIEKSRTKTTSAGRRHSPAVTSRSGGTDNHHGQYD